MTLQPFSRARLLEDLSRAVCILRDIGNPPDESTDYDRSHADIERAGGLARTLERLWVDLNAGDIAGIDAADQTAEVLEQIKLIWQQRDIKPTTTPSETDRKRAGYFATRLAECYSDLIIKQPAELVAAGETLLAAVNAHNARANTGATNLSIALINPLFDAISGTYRWCAPLIVPSRLPQASGPKHAIELPPPHVPRAVSLFVRAFLDLLDELQAPLPADGKPFGFPPPRAPLHSAKQLQAAIATLKDTQRSVQPAPADLVSKLERIGAAQNAVDADATATHEQWAAKIRAMGEHVAPLLGLHRADTVSDQLAWAESLRDFLGVAQGAGESGRLAHEIDVLKTSGSLADKMAAEILADARQGAEPGDIAASLRTRPPAEAQRVRLAVYTFAVQFKNNVKRVDPASQDSGHLACPNCGGELLLEDAGRWCEKCRKPEMTWLGINWRTNPPALENMTDWPRLRAAACQLFRVQIFNEDAMEQLEEWLTSHLALPGENEHQARDRWMRMSLADVAALLEVERPPAHDEMLLRLGEMHLKELTTPKTLQVEQHPDEKRVSEWLVNDRMKGKFHRWWHQDVHEAREWRLEVPPQIYALAALFDQIFPGTANTFNLFDRRSPVTEPMLLEYLHLRHGLDAAQAEQLTILELVALLQDDVSAAGQSASGEASPADQRTPKNEPNNPQTHRKHAKGKQRITKDEANLRARDALKGKPTGGGRWTVRKLAKVVGCSAGLVNDLSAWQAHPDREAGKSRNAKPAERRSPLAIETVAAIKASRSDDPSELAAAAELGRMAGGNEAELQRLIAEQSDDFEPSPTESTGRRKGKSAN